MNNPPQASDASLGALHQASSSMYGITLYQRALQATGTMHATLALYYLELYGWRHVRPYSGE